MALPSDVFDSDSSSGWTDPPTFADLFGNLFQGGRGITKNYMIQADAAYNIHGGDGLVIEGCYIDIPPTEVGIELLELIEGSATKEEAGMNRSEVIAARMAQLEKEMTAIKTVEDELPLQDGTVVLYVRTLGSGDATQEFTYAAVRANGVWYTTATRPAEGQLSDDAFIVMLSQSRTVSLVVLKEDRRIK